MTRAAAVMLMTPLAVLALIFATTGLVGGADKRSPAAPKATAFVWGDRVFTSPAGLRHWLGGRGIEYGRWLTQHPAAAAWVRGGAAPKTGHRSDDGLGITRPLVLVSLFGLLLIALWHQ